MDNKLTNVSNKPGTTDMYGSPIMPKPSMIDESSLPPGARENPDAGDWKEGSINVYCATCKRQITAEELAKPDHIGHALENGDGAYPNDVEGVVRKGGSYRLGWKTDGVKPIEG